MLDDPTIMKLNFFIVLFTISILSITGLYAYAVTLDVTSVGNIEDDSDKLLDGVLGTAISVSYTHLTLPTSDLV